MASAGKTTILKALLERQPHLGRLITSTTRLPRPREIEQVDYHFLSVQHFQAAVQSGQIVCPIRHRGHWYATARHDLEACTAKDMVAVLRPDKITALRQFAPLVGIYVSRLAHDQLVCPDDQVIVAHQHLCRYQVINVTGDLDAAVAHILSIIQAHAGG
jgi:guanylate kinase